MVRKADPLEQGEVNQVDQELWAEQAYEVLCGGLGGPIKQASVKNIARCS